MALPARPAHITQSWPDSGLGFEGNVLTTFKVVPISFGSGVGIPHGATSACDMLGGLEPGFKKLNLLQDSRVFEFLS